MLIPDGPSNENRPHHVIIGNAAASSTSLPGNDLLLCCLVAEKIHPSAARPFAYNLNPGGYVPVVPRKKRGCSRYLDLVALSESALACPLTDFFAEGTVRCSFRCCYAEVGHFTKHTDFGVCKYTLRLAS